MNLAGGRFGKPKEQDANSCNFRNKQVIRTYSNCLSGHDVVIGTSYTKTTIVLKSEMLYLLWLSDISHDLIKPAQPQNASKKRQENDHK